MMNAVSKPDKTLPARQFLCYSYRQPQLSLSRRANCLGMLRGGTAPTYAAARLGGIAMWPVEPEHDACALIANIRKTALPSHGNVKRTVDALVKMGHRSGEVAGEGDGCGLLVDIPRRIWARKLTEAGLDERVADDPRFVVGHAFILPEHRGRGPELRTALLERLAAAGIDVLL